MILLIFLHANTVTHIDRQAMQADVCTHIHAFLCKATLCYTSNQNNIVVFAFRDPGLKGIFNQFTLFKLTLAAKRNACVHLQMAVKIQRGS